ncbi:MAG: hypothetical protein AAF533_18130 [Acidobacteriota bacterium]
MTTSLAMRSGEEDALVRLLERELGELEPGGGLRAFAVGSTTCVLRWKPSRPELGDESPQEVHLRLRNATGFREHAALLTHVGLVTRTVLHHLRHFVPQAS